MAECSESTGRMAARLHGQLRHQFSGYDQRLLVSQGYLLPGTDGSHRRAKSSKAYESRQYDIHLRILNDLAEGILPGPHLDGQVAQCLSNELVLRLIGNHYLGRLELPRLSYQEVGLPVSRQDIRFVQVAMFLYHLQGLCPYATR